MRAGGWCTVQQALTMEAANVVKQSVTLARRRGHAQVTPLHVANTMLASSNGLFRIACLKSNSHPLQCKALELCFNVALNRLPSSPMLGHHPQNPSISNALVAAFKRAQAHQRRGSIENQQQPLLAVKIELDQLIISILDDPSVSRVMREADFSSSQVKSNVEKESNYKPKDEDVKSVIDSLVNGRKKSIVVVGESLANIDGVIRTVMDMVEKGDVPDGLKEVKFTNIPLFSSGQYRHREEVEQKMGELTCLVKRLVNKGVVLYLGDLRWITDFRASLGHQGGVIRSYYCPVEHMIIEFGRLLNVIGDDGRFWLMGIATYQTYTRCRSGNQSLETLWGLHPITLPTGGLGLSLSTESSESRSKTVLGNGSHREDQKEMELNCCADCSSKFEAEARSLRTGISNSESTLSSLPSWLKEESKRLKDNDQNCMPVRELYKKWNSFCSSFHKPTTKSLERTSTFSSSTTSPSSSTSFFSYDHQPKQSCNDQLGSSSDIIMEMDYYISRFKEFNSDNLNILCNALEQKVPWQKDVIPDIAGTILQCRSRMLTRKEKSTSSSIGRREVKEETWLFFQGQDLQAKEDIARELAKLIFGSYSKFVSIALSSFSSTKDDSTKDHQEMVKNKRSRDEQSCSYIGRLGEAICENPHRVFLVEDVEQADLCSKVGIKRAIQRGKINSSSGEEVSLCDAIIILSCESFSSRSRAFSPTLKQKSSDNSLEEDEEKGDQQIRPCVSLDLNISFDDHDGVDDDIGILENVDRRVVFKMREL